MKRLLVFLSVCVLAFAMVPRERRAVEESASAPAPAPVNREICAEKTPCAWSMYKANSRIIEFNITNTYCDCGVGTECLVNEVDETVNALVYRCRRPADVEGDKVES